MQHTLIAFIFLLLCSSLSYARDRALIIGISTYKHSNKGLTPLFGAVADAKRMESFITNKLGFASSDIKLLTNEKATASEIKDAFRTWLIADTKAGDRVFFFFAGHGSQIKDDNKDEDDGMDETIVAYDSDPKTQTNQISDDVFEELIAQLAGRKAVLIFDSCHSGTISRSSSITKNSSETQISVRYLPTPDQLQEIESITRSTRGSTPQSDKNLGYTILPQTNKGTTSRSNQVSSPFIDISKINSPDGIVILSAAAAYQPAQEFIFDSNIYGVFSYFFVELQKDKLLPLADLEEKISTNIEKLKEQDKIKHYQSPYFEIISPPSLKKLPLFGATQTASTIVKPQPSTNAAPITIPNELHNIINNKSNIKLSLNTTEAKTSYKLDDPISYKVTTNTEGYLYLFIFTKTIENEEAFVCLFPNKEYSNNLIKPGTISLPQDTNGYELTVGEPVGQDIVVALLSTVPLNYNYFSLPEGLSWQEVFSKLTEDLQKTIQKANNLQKGDMTKTKADWQISFILLNSSY